MHRLAVILAVVAAIGGPGWGESRVALVIGNGRYTEATLLNPPNDARLMASALRACGFEVDVRLDLDKRGMEEAIDRLGERIQRSGVGFFYYAGHGLQVKGKNWLVPVGAQPGKEATVPYDCVDAERVLSQMESAGNGLNVMVLDACRNNPFPSTLRAVSRGLTKMTVPSGTLLWYSARPGQQAPDGEGRNSPFTTALAAAIQTPGLDVEHVFKRVACDLTSTNRDHEPWQEGVFAWDFYFVPGVTAPPPPSVEGQGYLQVNVPVSGAQVYVSGKLRGTAGPGQPLNLTGLVPGRVTVRATAAGYRADSAVVTLVAGEWRSVTLGLVPLGPLAVPRVVPKGTVGSGAGGGSSSPPMAEGSVGGRR